MAGAGGVPGAGAARVSDIQLTVLGVAAPQGSKKHVGHGRMVESSKRVGPWREAIVAEAQRQGVAGAMLDGPLAMTVAILLPRPRGHYGTGRNADVVRPAAPRAPAGRPDLDKLLRAISDALTQAAVWRDDSCLCQVSAMKLYADSDPPQARIRLREW